MLRGVDAGFNPPLFFVYRQSSPFLQPGDDFPRLGEVHFASADFLPPSTPPTQVYCIVNELSRRDEFGCFSFVGGFPFIVLSAACVIPVEVNFFRIEPLSSIGLTAIAGQAGRRCWPQRTGQWVAKTLRSAQHAANFLGRGCLFRRN